MTNKVDRQQRLAVQLKLCFFKESFYFIE